MIPTTDIELPPEMAIHQQVMINEINNAANIEELREMAIAAVKLNFATRALMRKLKLY